MVGFFIYWCYMFKMKQLFQANFLTTGLAMFAMFFGSGNLIFPVAVGQFAGEQTIWAIGGLFLTAVFMPFFALCVMFFYNGSYKEFFSKIGILPAKLVALIILALIGPFGVVPRCIAFSYSTFSLYFHSVTLFQFCLVSSIIIFLLSYKKSDVVGVIGNLLTPILLFSIGVIIYKGLTSPSIALPNELSVSNSSMFLSGIVEGYKTFDIFAALFFATAIMPAFRKVLKNENASQKSFLALAFKSSLVGMVLLFAVYAGLAFVAAKLSAGLIGVQGDRLIGVISTLTMGTGAGLIANLTVSLACLTTAISLAVVSAEFFREEIFLNKLSYEKNLFIVVLLSFVFSLMGFSGIMSLILPILMVLCPAIIVLIIANALNHFFKFPYVKSSFYLTLLLSFIYNFLN